MKEEKTERYYGDMTLWEGIILWGGAIVSVIVMYFYFQAYHKENAQRDAEASGAKVLEIRKVGEGCSFTAIFPNGNKKFFLPAGEDRYRCLVLQEGDAVEIHFSKSRGRFSWHDTPNEEIGP
jgi:hypothetical protein